MPAFEPGQRRRTLPVTCAIPVLVAGGVRSDTSSCCRRRCTSSRLQRGEFNVLVQASQYYKFAASNGTLFQVPVAITLLLETLPLYLLFEVSVLIASLAQRRERRPAARLADSRTQASATEQ